MNVMTKLRVKDKRGLGRLVLSAAENELVRNTLIANPRQSLESFLENLSPDHLIKVVVEEKNVTYLVLPSADDVPSSTEDKESILREEAREYDQAKEHVEKSKGKTGQIPSAVVEDTYALMVGHTALSASSRPRSRPRPRRQSRSRSA
jgi:hypothetical protein